MKCEILPSGEWAARVTVSSTSACRSAAGRAQWSARRPCIMFTGEMERESSSNKPPALRCRIQDVKGLPARAHDQIPKGKGVGWVQKKFPPPAVWRSSVKYWRVLHRETVAQRETTASVNGLKPRAAQTAGSPRAFLFDLPARLPGLTKILSAELLLYRDLWI